MSSNGLERRRLKAVDISASAIGTEKLQRNLNYIAWVHSQGLALTISVCFGKLLSFWASDFPLGKWGQPWYYTELHDSNIRGLAWCLAYEIKNISCFYYFSLIANRLRFGCSCLGKHVLFKLFSSQSPNSNQ